MKTKQLELSISDINKGYTGKETATALGGSLSIRPDYQRQFIYPTKRQIAVIETLLSNAPIGTMYWSQLNDKYEVIDGQQRLLSILEYINGGYKTRTKYFNELTKIEQQLILNYKPLIFQLETDDTDEIFKWWERINYPGTQLSNMEILAGSYHGNYMLELKKFFGVSGSENVNQKLYVKGSIDRLDNLENILDWHVCPTEDRPANLIERITQHLIVNRVD